MILRDYARQSGLLVEIMVALISNLRDQWRRTVLGRRLGIRIPRDVYIARTAQLQMMSDGRWQGGTIRLGQGVRISDGAILAPYGGSIILEDGVYIGPFCVLYGHGGLRIGRDSMVAAHSVIIPSNHSFDDSDKPISHQGARSQGIEIGQDVWIGCGARILDGVTLGDGCVIGSGAVVTRSIERNCIAVGVPARVIGVRGATPSACAAP